jgi:hypothetical protein
MMDANEIAEKLGKLLLPGEYIEGVEVTDDLVKAEIAVDIRYFVQAEPFSDRLVVGGMHVEDAAARLLAYLERRHE